MIFGILTLLTALTIAGVAAWFSIEGLMAIFSASAIPIAIMAGSLEVGKLLTASWLYRYWKDTGILMKTYLVTAVLALMLITSMGIFGYLSKAHLDQAAVSGDAIAKVERFEQLIARERATIATSEERIASLQAGNGDISNTSITQQETIRDGAWQRVQGDIDYNQDAIKNIRSQLTTDLAAVDTQLQTNLSGGRERLAALDRIVESYTSQGTVTTETKSGGVFSRSESETVDNVAKGAEVRAQQKPERDEIAEQQRAFQQGATEQKAELRRIANAEITKLQANIDKYRAQAQSTIDAANAEINRIRQAAGDSAEQSEEKITELNGKIDAAFEEIERINQEKFEAERIVRELEQEVGPIKYVAELVYGEGSEGYLDKAVRLFILLLVVVFDPLAVVLVIAANQTLLRYGINLEAAGPELPTDKDPHDQENPPDPQLPTATTEPQEDPAIQEPDPELEQLREQNRSLQASLAAQQSRPPRTVEKEVIVEVENTDKIAELAAEVEKLLAENDALRNQEFTLDTPDAIKQLEEKLAERFNNGK